MIKDSNTLFDRVHDLDYNCYISLIGTMEVGRCCARLMSVTEREKRQIDFELAYARINSKVLLKWRYMGKDMIDYTRRSAKYGKYIRTYRDPELSLLMLETLGLNVQFKALDLGCGQGDSSRHLRAIGADVFYADLNFSMLSRGIKRGLIPRDKAIMCDIAGKLPFKNNTFDLAVLRYVLHDVKDKKALLTEIYSLLKPNGIIQIVDMCCKNTEEKSFYNDIHSRKTFGEVSPCWIIMESELRGFLQDCNFEVTAKAWYTSVVNSEQWLKEEQISCIRHVELLQLTKKWLAESPSIKKAFGISLRNSSACFRFPVIVTVGKKKEGE